MAVELLTPKRGKNNSKPIMISGLSAYAEPIRFLDFLLADIQPATLLYKHGVLINVPAPARFAFHKLVVSQRRRSSDVEKIKRDLSQAEQLFETLMDNRPGDLILAYEAVEMMGGKFLQQLNSGMDLIDSKIKTDIKSIIGCV